MEFERLTFLKLVLKKNAPLKFEFDKFLPDKSMSVNMEYEISLPLSSKSSGLTNVKSLPMRSFFKNSTSVKSELIVSILFMIASDKFAFEKSASMIFAFEKSTLDKSRLEKSTPMRFELDRLAPRRYASNTALVCVICARFNPDRFASVKIILHGPLHPSHPILFSKLEFFKFEFTREMSFTYAPLKSVFDKSEPDKFASKKLVLINLRFERFFSERSTFVRLAPSKLAPSKLTSDKFTLNISVPYRFAFFRLAPSKLAPVCSSS